MDLLLSINEDALPKSIMSCHCSHLVHSLMNDYECISVSLAIWHVASRLPSQSHINMPNIFRMEWKYYSLYRYSVIMPRAVWYKFLLLTWSQTSVPLESPSYSNTFLAEYHKEYIQNWPRGILYPSIEEAPSFKTNEIAFLVLYYLLLWRGDIVHLITFVLIYHYSHIK